MLPLLTLHIGIGIIGTLYAMFTVDRSPIIGRRSNLSSKD